MITLWINNCIYIGIRMSISISQKYSALRLVAKEADSVEKRSHIITNLAVLARNRHYISRGSNNIPDSLQGAIVDLYKSENQNTLPTELDCVNLLRALCDESLANNEGDNRDILAITRILSQPNNRANNLFNKILTGSKGLFIGKSYQILDYVKHPHKNSKSRYAALDLLNVINY